MSETISCRACGTSNEEGRKFCGECGAALGEICPTCGTANSPGVKFCGECGTSLTATTDPTVERRTDETERRLVSVLFLDLVGFTTLAEGRDPEDTRSLLSAYFDMARAIIERHGGIVEKFIGDAVMAVWGTPVAYEDDAERAVRTALELVDGVHALGEAEGLTLEARAGVLTGEAATRPGAMAEGMVAGDMVNTASRLQSAAGPGAVFVGEATYRAASRAVAFEEVGEISVKGKELPIAAWRVLRVVAERGGANRMTIEPPFVGRTEELRLLKEQLHATGRDGKARVVSITGIGGIGKSRLVWELEKYVDGLAQPIAWHQGRCPSYGEGVTFWALGEMVRMRADIAEGDTPQAAQAKLRRSIETYVPDADERAWVEPRLMFLLALDERPPGSGEELFAAWRTFFQRIADVMPVVMVFEDVQWADSGMLDFIESMLEWSRDHSILVITLARPELADRRPNWGLGQRPFSSIHLDPLPNEAMLDLVRGLVPAAPPEAVDQIVARSEGVPLYAVETLRMLADRGILAVGETSYDLVKPLVDFEIPETLQALIASRLDALDPGDRSLLQDAAVLGKSFTIDSLALLSGEEPDRLESRLRDLARKEFLLLEADPRSPERGQYLFTQALIREVAYGTLSRNDRRSRHLSAAHVFEATGDMELAGIVAAHYVEALAAAPEGPEATALAARARDWLRQASERAISLGSPAQALAYTQQAMALAAEGDELRELTLLAAEAAGDALKPDERQRYLREAADLASLAHDSVDEARILGDLVESLLSEDDEDAIFQLTDSMEARFGEVDDPNLRAYVADARALAAFCRDDFKGSLGDVDIALTGFESMKDEKRLLRAITRKIYLLDTLGRRTEAAMLARGSVESLRRAGDLRQLTRALGAAGLALSTDDPRGAFECLLEAISVARKAGFGSSEMSDLGNAIEMAIELGDWEKADEMLERMKEVPSSSTTISDALALNLAVLAAYRGDHETASRHLSAVQREAAVSFGGWVPRVRSVVLTHGGEPEAGYHEAMKAIEADRGGWNSPMAFWAAGRAALWSKDLLSDAVTRIREANEVTSNLGGAWIANARAGFEAATAGIEGRRDEAIEKFTMTLKTWRSLQLPLDHAAVVGDALVVLGPDAIPGAEVDAAVEFLEGIGAGPLLRRILTVLTPPDLRKVDTRV